MIYCMFGNLMNLRYNLHLFNVISIIYIYIYLQRKRSGREGGGIRKGPRARTQTWDAHAHKIISADVNYLNLSEV